MFGQYLLDWLIGCSGELFQIIYGAIRMVTTIISVADWMCQVL